MAKSSFYVKRIVYIDFDSIASLATCLCRQAGSVILCNLPLPSGRLCDIAITQRATEKSQSLPDGKGRLHKEKDEYYER